MSIREEIGLKIAIFRKESGLSQRDLAEKAGLTQNTIYKIENGKFSVGIDVLGKVAEALNRKIDII
ncbi:helix-turn-helix domain-containing protein [uncultured Parabacteroides sp.]|uniref:helix-turn-helix domain-containing protein n=1 Tax=uncultured Parabacteroides sp. TaxID=512312 RepID=UPI0025FA1E56|nr:helix-turn-helix transcriptional regulator [uncultured Parabacteroides sp.]